MKQTAREYKQVIKRLRNYCPYTNNELNNIEQMLAYPELLKEHHVEEIRLRCARVAKGELPRQSIPAPFNQE